MSAGIYMNNGVLAYSMNLEKKLKRRKNAIVIEEYKGDPEITGDELERVLQDMLDKHKSIVKEGRIEEKEDKPLKYHWKNKVTNHTIHSIYSTLTNIPGIKLEEWEPYEE